MKSLQILPIFYEDLNTNLNENHTMLIHLDSIKLKMHHLFPKTLKCILLLNLLELYLDDVLKPIFYMLI